nr:adaptive-response sensory-kinase SasA [uncultured bacterium]
MLCDILEGPEYHLICAASGPEALRLLLENDDFSVILLGVSMREMDGFELASIIRQRERMTKVPLLFLAGADADEPLVVRGYRAGAVDFLFEPFLPEIVRSKVRVFAEMFRQKRRIEEQTARLLEAERREGELLVLELRLASERRLRALANAMPQIIWVSRADGTIEYFNTRWFEYTGLSAEATAGTWRGVVHPDDAESSEAAWTLATRERVACTFEVRLRAADGAYRWHLARALPEQASTHEVTSWIGTFTDIEDQKRAEHEKELLYREAAEAVRVRDEFMSIASHELRTPLSSLKLQLEMLLRTDQEAAAITVSRPKLDLAWRQVGRLERLVTELLEVSRITTGRMGLECQRFDLSSLVDEVVARLTLNASTAGCTVNLHSQGVIDGCWDRFRLDQVVTNLLTNAFKFGAGRPIDVSLRMDGDRAYLSVHDRGIGIAAGDAERIFQRFERAVPARSYGGLGLGLFIVRQIIEAHGGTIHVESRLGEGSTFTIELPRTPPNASSHSRQ